LRDARKLGLLPSVTNVLGVINKPELVEWKMTQAVLAALTLPRQGGEGEDAFARRVVEDAQSRVRTAADFGSAFHAGAEEVAKTLEVDPAGPYAAWLKLHRDWFQSNCVRVLWTERVLVNLEMGYAGTADLLIEHRVHGLTLVDYKTQGAKGGKNGAVGEHGLPGGRPRDQGSGALGERALPEGKTQGQGSGAVGDRALPGGKTHGGSGALGEHALPGWKPRAYGGWCQQLAAYRRALGTALAEAPGGAGGPVSCLNVVVNSTEPMAPVEHLWSEEELQAGWESFEAALVIWRNEKGYDPRRNTEGDAEAAKDQKAGLVLVAP
jgi:hypothetical protein